MAYSTLPTIPLIILGVIEPLLLIWAYITCLNDPFAYYATQSPTPVLDAARDFPPQAAILSLMVGNVLLLLAALAVACCFSSSATTAKWYLIAVAFADYGHIYSCYVGLGPDVFWDISQWNDMIVGNVGASLVLNVVRWFTLLGVFGRLGQASRTTGSGKKRN